MTKSSDTVLTINTGSSSLKAALYQNAPAERRKLAIQAERIGTARGRVRIADANGATLLDEERDLTGQDTALHALLSWLHDHRSDHPFDAVGHRVVHGGMHYREPQRVTPALLTALQQLTLIDPDHLPQALSAIRTVGEAHPDLPQVACFDTAFHRHMPPVAQRYALPHTYGDAGIIRYGFHGLSYEYIMQALRAEDRGSADRRVIIAHLGNGASMVAVRGGMSIDTTMGFTPTGGLVMGTRVGDLDPSVPLYLLRSRSMTSDEVVTLLTKEAGMRGVSGTSGDMRDLLEKESSDPRAAEAVALFCYQAKKFVGALAAALGGLDTLIFTGGIGEHAAPVRKRICADLEFFGIQLDPKRNAADAPVISADDGAVTVRVMPTDEDLMIARHTYRLLAQGGTDGFRIPL
ncbi:MAG: acetate/propionate family kinase [Chloroflexota bacterium]|nr:acetate/propionate family kinase [Chloroflexota bacterium]